MVVIWAAMAGSIVYGVILMWWHRKLMSELLRRHPSVWEQLGPLFFANRIWRHSTRLPIWSWKSLLFFITRKYASVPDRIFVNRAARFRAALIGWLLLCVFLTIGALWWQARISR
jgi:hypothetical protein